MDVGRKGEADAVVCPVNIRPAERVRMMLANLGPAQPAAVKPCYGDKVRPQRGQENALGHKVRLRSGRESTLGYVFTAFHGENLAIQETGLSPATPS
jgi:hypothetical protein